MHRAFLTTCLLALPLLIGCGGAAPAPTSVTQDERQQMADAEKSVEAEERAHQAQNR